MADRSQAKSRAGAWTRKEGKRESGGLNQKGVDSYKRENPGSKLKTAVREKNPTGKRKRRKIAFCKRMRGMKRKLTSKKTANDPNSRINKSLRAWNCNWCVWQDKCGSHPPIKWVRAALKNQKPIPHGSSRRWVMVTHVQHCFHHETV